MLTVTAPAKINLFLHVTGQRPDGYHLLDSLTVFAADIYDTLVFESAAQFALSVTGKTARIDDAGMMTDNIVMRAANAFFEKTGQSNDFAVHLEKRIPAGAGLGGGSADAAAAMRAMEDMSGARLSDRDRTDLMTRLGVDVPVCHYGRSCRFSGIGDVIEDVPPLPSMALTIVWPDAHLSTQDVFRARKGNFGQAAPPLSSIPSFEDTIMFLEETRNDLADAAENLCPPVAQARQALEQTDGCRLARMSGSGSSVFGIFETMDQAERAAEIIRHRAPSWWVKATRLLP